MKELSFPLYLIPGKEHREYNKILGWKMPDECSYIAFCKDGQRINNKGGSYRFTLIRPLESGILIQISEAEAALRFGEI